MDGKIFKKIVGILLSVVLLAGPMLQTFGIVQAADASSGKTYFTDTDNWGGGPLGTEAADGDMDVDIKNQNKTTADNYSKYPIEFKIKDVAKLPTQSANMLIRAYDVDEIASLTKTGSNGEWDRVYFSKNPADIALVNPYTAWQTSGKWKTSVAASGVGTGGQGYLKELTRSAYLGTLSGQNEQWNTTVLPFKKEDLGRIALGDNYVGLSIHHYFNDKESRDSVVPNTNWTMKVDWAQLVIDGGERQTGEIDNVGIKVENGKITLDASFIPKLPGKDYSMEVSVVEKREFDGELIDKNVGLDKKLFEEPTAGQEQTWKTEFTDSTFSPSKEYTVNVILFDDRGGGTSGEKYTNPGEAQHIYTFSTFDPVAKDITKAGFQYEPTAFNANEFSGKYYQINGNAYGSKLQKVKIVTLPDAEKGQLVLNETAVKAGDEISVNDLGQLTFVPVATGFTGNIDFKWNGYDGSKYGAVDAVVTLTATAAPTVGHIEKSSQKGNNVPFIAKDFTDKFVNSKHDPLTKVKIITVPAEGQGKLVYRVGNGPEQTVTPGVEISAADLASLSFIPTAETTGTVAFQWNGTDGKQYAKESKNVTITINAPPVVADIHKTGAHGAAIPFTTDDFANVYKDDNSNLSTVRITLPADFAANGQLYYNNTVTEAVYLEPGIPAVLSKADLGSLTFVPDTKLAEGTEVKFKWEGYDGQVYSENLAEVIITYNGLPVANALSVEGNEGVSSLTVVLKGTDRETVTGLTYGIATPPLKGILTPADPGNPAGDTWIYTPNSDFISGKDSFTYVVTDADGQTSPVEATVKIELHKALNGWVGNKKQGDPTIVKAIPGQPLKLSAVSSLAAEKVTANVADTSVNLTLANPLTYETDGFKQWEYTTFVLPLNTTANSYAVSFSAWGAGDAPLAGEAADKLIDNNYQVVQTELILSANPERILGDGKATTELTAVLKDSNGNPIKGIEVVFTAAVGGFVGNDRAVTDDNGIAKVTYHSAQITGVSEQNIPVQANVNNAEHGLLAKSEITITFLPASIQGFITTGGSNTPVASAQVRATLDLNGDGKIEPGVDFIENIVTDEKGAYYLVVPKGDAKYELEITQTVDVGGVPTAVTYKQYAKVGQVTGSGDENFESEKTLTGLVLFKQTNGQSSLLNSEWLGHASVFLKQQDGSYVSENGKPKAFPLQAQGVFNAEGLAVGQYELEVRYELESGKSIVVSRNTVAVTAAGELNISQSLVDPYGTITDAVTGHVIEGAKVMLHYADTPRNASKGLTPNGEVTLPVIAGFAPNDNASPKQLSDSNGFYAYMVYPDTDYYLMVTNEGYINYKSPVLSVGTDIVRHDVQLQPVPNTSGATPSTSTDLAVKVALTLSVEKNTVKENEQSPITVVYKNDSSAVSATGEVKITLPDGVVVVDAAGGTVTGNVIVWKVTNVGVGKGGSFTPVVKWPLIDAAEVALTVPGEFTSGQSSAKALVKVNIYSDRFGELKHYRYILGYPDKEFKLNGSLTRAELAAIVARLTENETITYALPYSDIRAGHWATNYIRIAVKNGYFTGDPNGLFRPDAPVTRGELASVMARFLKIETGTPAVTHFTDTSGHWSGNAIEALYNGKFLTGYPDGTFKPKNAITRVEAVTLINRMLYRGPLKGLAPLFPDIAEDHWGFGDVQEATFSHEAVRNGDGSEKWLRSLSDDVK
jgi:hypothetical protein